MAYSGIQNGSKLSRAGNDAGFDIAEIAKRVAEQESALAKQIEQEFEDAIQGSSMEDTAALAALGQTAMRLGAAGLTSTVHAVTTRIEEAAARKTAAQADAFDPREERNRNDRKDRDEELLRDFRQDARQALRQMQEEQERQRAERETQKIGDVEMSRADWGRLASALQNDERHRNWFIQHFLQQGLSREEAERKMLETQRLGEILNKREELWTPEERSFVKEKEHDPYIQKGLKEYSIWTQSDVAASHQNAKSATQGDTELAGASNRANFFASGEISNRAIEPVTAPADGVSPSTRISLAAAHKLEGGIATQNLAAAFNPAASGAALSQAADPQLVAQPPAQRLAQQTNAPALNADALL